MNNKKVKIQEIQPMHQTHRNKMTFYDSHISHVHMFKALHYFKRTITKN